MRLVFLGFGKADRVRLDVGKAVPLGFGSVCFGGLSHGTVRQLWSGEVRIGWQRSVGFGLAAMVRIGPLRCVLVAPRVAVVDVGFVAAGVSVARDIEPVAPPTFPVVR